MIMCGQFVATFFFFFGASDSPEKSFIFIGAVPVKNFHCYSYLDGCCSIILFPTYSSKKKTERYNKGLGSERIKTTSNLIY